MDSLTCCSIRKIKGETFMSLGIYALNDSDYILHFYGFMPFLFQKWPVLLITCIFYSCIIDVLK